MTADITFSHPIRNAAVLDTANWFVRLGGTQYTVTAAAAALGIVTLTTVLGPLDAGPDVITFTPPPFDVISDTAVPVPAPAFADFPLHV